MMPFEEIDNLGLQKTFVNLLAETNQKIVIIENKEFGDNIYEDLLLKDYANYFESTISILKNQSLLKNNDLVASEFNALSQVNVQKTVKKSPFNFFTIFNDYLEGSGTSRDNYNLAVLKMLRDVRARCENLIYFLKIL